MTPFMKEAFTAECSEKRLASSSEYLSITTEFTKRNNQARKEKLIHYIKSVDMETALNALFVLSEEN